VRDYGPAAMRVQEAARQYARQGHDLVRRRFEERLLGRLLPRLLDASRGGALLDLGCGDGLAARLAEGRLTRYLGVDLCPATRSLPSVAHDLRDGLGPVGPRPFDLYLGSFGLASHLGPVQLDALLREIADHARPGSVVALEALGLNSLEWPRLWEAPIGSARTIPYRLGADVDVHPWAPAELLGRFAAAGLEPIGAIDRTVQAGPKLDEGRYWRGLPAVRAALSALLSGESPCDPLTAPLPPLPAGVPALVHHTLADRRRRLVRHSGLGGAALAEAVWALEPLTAGGYGHGLLAVGRAR
jgi:SAM-dependent methyltransferase